MIERFAEARDGLLECVLGTLGRLAAPELFEEPVAGDDLIAVEQEQREQGALSGSRHRDRT